MKPLLGLALAALLSLASLNARAEPCPDAAGLKKLTEKADAAFAQNRYEEARAAYDRAHGCSNDPSLLFNLSKAYENLGQLPEAARAMRAFLRDSPNLSSEVRSAAERSLEALNARLGRLSVSSNTSGARVLVDGVEIGVVPIDAFDLMPKTLELRVEAPLMVPFSERIELGAGKSLSVRADLQPQKLVVAGPSLPFWTWIGFGVGGGATLLAVASGTVSLLQTSDIVERCGGDQQCPADTEQARNEALTWANVCNVSIGVAAAGVAVGVIGLIVGLTSSPDAGLSVSVGPTGVALLGRFP